MDKTLTFAQHTSKTIEKIQKYIEVLYPLVCRRSRMNRDNKLLLCKSVFQSIITYGCPVWSNMASTHLNKLQIQQNKCLKMICDLPFWYSTNELHLMTKIRQVKDVVDSTALKFFERCSQSENPLVSQLQRSV